MIQDRFAPVTILQACQDFYRTIPSPMPYSLSLDCPGVIAFSETPFINPNLFRCRPHFMLDSSRIYGVSGLLIAFYCHSISGIVLISHQYQCLSWPSLPTFVLRITLTSIATVAIYAFKVSWFPASLFFKDQLAMWLYRSPCPVKGLSWFRLRFKLGYTLIHSKKEVNPFFNFFCVFLFLFSNLLKLLKILMEKKLIFMPYYPFIIKKHKIYFMNEK